jgi:hypothetical protein
MGLSRSKIIAIVVISILIMVIIIVVSLFATGKVGNGGDGGDGGNTIDTKTSELFTIVSNKRLSISGPARMKLATITRTEDSSYTSETNNNTINEQNTVSVRVLAEFMVPTLTTGNGIDEQTLDDYHNGIMDLLSIPMECRNVVSDSTVGSNCKRYSFVGMNVVIGDIGDAEIIKIANYSKEFIKSRGKLDEWVVYINETSSDGAFSIYKIVLDKAQVLMENRRLINPNSADLHVYIGSTELLGRLIKQ